MNNLKIVLVDVDSRNGNINFKKIEEKINKKTVAIIPVDYAGVPADLDEINIISKKHGLYVVHDAAQSFGSKYKNKVIGSQAEVTCFSFHGTKNLTTGEGGAIATNSDLLAEKIAICREKGTDKHLFLTHKKTKGYYEFISKGNSYVQSNLLGAMGISQLERIDEMNDKRKRIAQKLIESLKDIPEIEFPYIPEYCVSNWHLFNILVSPEKKNWIIDALISEGIHANIHYKPLHMNQYYSDLGKDTDFPGSVQFYNRLVRLPMYPSLQNDEVEDVITALKKVLKNI